MKENELHPLDQAIEILLARQISDSARLSAGISILDEVCKRIELPPESGVTFQELIAIRAKAYADLELKAYADSNPTHASKMTTLVYQNLFPQKSSSPES